MGQELPAAKNLPRIKLVIYFSFLIPTGELFICSHFCFEDDVFAIVSRSNFVNSYMSIHVVLLKEILL